MSAKNKLTKSSPNPSAGPDAISPKTRSWSYPSLYWMIPLLLTAITYFASIQNGFVNFDDELYITLNHRITQLNAESIRIMFSTFLGGNYHPLTEFSYAIDYAISGQHDPSIYHGMNYLYHLINTALVFVFIRQLSRGHVEVAAWVSLLFGIHPMHVESVAWISERKDVLYSLFCLLSLIQYMRFKERRENKFLGFSVFFFLLSCLCKSMAVTLPLLLILIDYYWNEEPISTKTVLNKIPYLLISLTFGILAIQSQKAQGYLADYSFSILEKIAISCYSLCFYLFKSIIPINLSCLHPMPLHGLSWPYYASLMIIPLLGWILWRYRSQGRYWVFGLFFFLISMSLVLQFISFGAAVVAERYTYMPYLGLFFALAMFLDHLSTREKSKHWQSSIRLSMLGLCILFAFISFQRSKVWKDGESLWRDCVAQYPNTAGYAWYGLGNILKDKLDKPELRQPDENAPSKEEILHAYEQAIRINESFPNYYINGSAARSSFGDKAGAFLWQNKAIQLDPSNAINYFNRAIIHTDLKQNEKALQDYTEAIRLKNDYWEAYFNRALLYQKLQQDELALKDYLVVQKLNPGYFFTFKNRGDVFYHLGKYEEAIQEYNKALALDPKHSNTIKNRGAAKLALKRHEEACTDFEAAMNLGDAEGKDAFMHLCQ